MLQQIEISRLDLRFEGHRLKNKVAEMKLLTSISENGIRDPLQGVESADMYVLLNGFKRYRCAKKLSISIVPYCNLVQGDTGTGIIELLRISNSKSLNILEQAKLIDELKSVYQMSTKDIADLLEKSKAWVSARTGIIKEISKNTMDKIMDGQFPIYAYMYILRSFIRMNKIRKEDIDEFVTLISGKDLSIRDIEILAN
jgi:ParB/RepB/Spo0J family partition protein